MSFTVSDLCYYITGGCAEVRWCVISHLHNSHYSHGCVASCVSGFVVLQVLHFKVRKNNNELIKKNYQV